MSSILDFFPKGLTPRPAQATLLKQVERVWGESDVVVLMCPPASGKTEIATTIACWQASTRVHTTYVVPDNMLAQQTAARYTLLQPLYRVDYYTCDHGNPTCEAECRRENRALALAATKRSYTRLMNSHVYRANKLFTPVVIFDEAHKIKDLLSDAYPVVFSQAAYKFPNDLHTVADLLAWGHEYLEARDDEKLRSSLEAISRVRGGSRVKYHTTTRKGVRDTIIEVRPAQEHVAASKLWPVSKVRKIVLMSGTIGTKDVQEVGLDDRRVTYLTCESPIPAEQRPVVYRRVANMAASSLEYALPLLAADLLKLLDLEPGKGLVHLPYSMAAKLRAHLEHSRLVWHDKFNKQEVLAEFAASDPSQGRVLVASGLYEGVDLPWDDDSWQVLAKVPYPSLGDEEVKAALAKDPDWYDWQAIKLLLQAYGRLPRRPEGRGTTYITDIAYERLAATDSRRKVKMFPAHYIAATKRPGGGQQGVQ